MEFKDFEDFLFCEGYSFPDITSSANENKTFDQLCDELLALSNECDKTDIKLNLQVNNQIVSEKYFEKVPIKSSDIHIVLSSDSESQTESKIECLHTSIVSGKLTGSDHEELKTDKQANCLPLRLCNDELKTVTARNEYYCAPCVLECKQQSKTIEDTSFLKNLQSNSQEQQSLPNCNEDTKSNIITFVEHSADAFKKQDEDCIITNCLIKKRQSVNYLTERNPVENIQVSMTSQDAMKNNCLKSRYSLEERSSTSCSTSSLTKYTETAEILKNVSHQINSKHIFQDEKKISQRQLEEKKTNMNVQNPIFSNMDGTSVKNSSTCTGNEYSDKTGLQEASLDAIENKKESSSKEINVEDLSEKKCISSCDESVVDQNPIVLRVFEQLEWDNMGSSEIKIYNEVKYPEDVNNFEQFYFVQPSETVENMDDKTSVCDIEEETLLKANEMKITKSEDLEVFVNTVPVKSPMKRNTYNGRKYSKNMITHSKNIIARNELEKNYSFIKNGNELSNTSSSNETKNKCYMNPLNNDVEVVSVPRIINNSAQENSETSNTEDIIQFHESVFCPLIVNTYSFACDTVFVADNFTNTQNEVEIIFSTSDEINEIPKKRDNEIGNAYYLPTTPTNNTSISYDCNINDFSFSFDRKIAVASRRRGAARLVPFTRTTRSGVNWGICRSSKGQEFEAFPITKSSNLSRDEILVKMEKCNECENEEVDVIATNQKKIVSSQLKIMKDDEVVDEHPVTELFSKSYEKNSEAPHLDNTYITTIVNTKFAKASRKRISECLDDLPIPSTKKQKLETEESHSKIQGVSGSISGSSKFQSKCRNFCRISDIPVDEVPSSSNSRKSGDVTPNNISTKHPIQDRKHQLEGRTSQLKNNDFVSLPDSEKFHGKLKQSIEKDRLKTSNLFSETTCNLFNDDTIKKIIFSSEKSDSSKNISKKTNNVTSDGLIIAGESQKTFRYLNRGRSFERNIVSESISAEKSPEKIKSEISRNPTKLFKSITGLIPNGPKNYTETDKSHSSHQHSLKNQFINIKDTVQQKISLSANCLSTGDGEKMSPSLGITSSVIRTRPADSAASMDRAVLRGPRRLRKRTATLHTFKPTSESEITSSPALDVAPTKRLLRRRIVRQSLTSELTNS